MVDVKMVVLSIIAVLSVFLQPGIRPQPTIDSSSEDDSCSQPEEECELEAMENTRLRSALENKRQKIEALENKLRRLRIRELQSVTATFIHSLTGGTNFNGITKVEDRIFLNRDYPSTVKVFEDGTDFRFIKEIALDAAVNFRDIVYSNESKCVYMSDSFHRCIWMMTTTGPGEHRMSKWLTNITSPNTLSLTNEGHLLVLRRAEPFSQLEIYSLNATLFRCLQLSQDIKNPQHVVQTSVGNFIIIHQLNIRWDAPWEISQLTNDGQLFNRFIPRNQLERLDHPEHLSLDLDNNRLFVAERTRVILFDSSDLSWSQVLLTYIVIQRRHPDRLFYDARNKHLFVAKINDNVTIYKIT